MLDGRRRHRALPALTSFPFPLQSRFARALVACWRRVLQQLLRQLLYGEGCALRRDCVQSSGPHLSRAVAGSRHARRRLVQAASRSAGGAAATTEAWAGSLATPTLDGRTQSCELRDDSMAGAGWNVMQLENGDPLFSRRCASEQIARYVPETARKDVLRTGWAEAQAPSLS